MCGKQARHFLRDKDARALLRQASEKLKTDLEKILGKKANLEVVVTEHAEIILVDGKPLLFRTAGKIYPALTFEKYLSLAPKIVVDMGAIPYVCKGAHVMAPGIRRFEGEFKKGDLVVVVDEKHGKFLAIGESLYDDQDAKTVTKGAVVTNVHFVGDAIWGHIKSLR